MPPAKSNAWKYFKRCADSKTVKCTLCSCEMTYTGGTTNMLNHLRLKHPSENKISDTQKQHSMDIFVNTKNKITETQSEKITQAIANMIVKDYIPLSIVESEGFLNLMQIVVPEYKVPSRNTVKSRIEKRYDDERESLVKNLESVQSVSLTTDTWTSNATDSYMTITEHHLTDDWVMESNVLMTREMQERHTGENLANKLKDCVSEFGLENKIGSIVHDNARNMQSASEKCEDWGDVGCFGHTLQLCVKPALELPNVSKIVAKSRKLVGHFKHSTTLTAEMRNRQKVFKVPEHELIQDVPTRWNSTHLMLERLCEQKRVITDIMLDDKFTKKSDSNLLLKDHEWDNILDLKDVLKDFTAVTTYISTETNVSCSQIYPIVCGLMNTSVKVINQIVEYLKY
ncbi:zinc finger BED domain-containing protein 4-like [Ruditapes philippinarum]|uniref:zinc finger BED domain-containing protein 4-like n=1 Tax=Ruditapes philippinarum TaxID=129788 RepID=UPI00295B5BD9|nr:zinc finger BED domain-containing protein 4-like [Ruditapes philippinarum]